jgi:hypothetical protein
MKLLSSLILASLVIGCGTAKVSYLDDKVALTYSVDSPSVTTEISAAYDLLKNDVGVTLTLIFKNAPSLPKANVKYVKVSDTIYVFKYVEGDSASLEFLKAALRQGAVVLK